MPLSSSPRRPSPKLLLVVAVAVAACAVAGCALVLTRGGPRHLDRPEATVRSFLTALTVDHDGDEAYTYIAPDQRRALADAAHGSVPLRSLLDGVSLDGPDGPLDSDHAIDALRLRTRVDGRRAVVVVPLAGGDRALHLIDVGLAGREEFGAPATPWRIDGGLDALVG